MKIVFISDTHNKLDWIKDMPEADVLVHCGDYSGRGNLDELLRFSYELKTVAKNYKHVLLTSGNHDRYAEYNHPFTKMLFQDNGFHYLIDESVEIEGVTFYGAPWSPNFYDWAFMPERGEGMARVWARIPDKVDVLFTHSPAYGHKDLTGYIIGDADRHVGCEELLKVVERIKPKIHAFGHIHHDYGVKDWYWGTGERTVFINCSICDEGYNPTRRPIVVEIDNEQKTTKIQNG